MKDEYGFSNARRGAATVSHPGQILKDLYLDPLNMMPEVLAEKAKLSKSYVKGIIRGEWRISSSAALKLAKFFGNTPQFWCNLQNSYDIYLV